MPAGAGTLQTEASLESHQRMVADKLSVSELMTTQLVALEPVMRVRPALEQLLLPWTLHCASPCQARPSLCFERDSPVHRLLSLCCWCASICHAASEKSMRPAEVTLQSTAGWSVPSWRQLTSRHVWGWHQLPPSHVWLQVHDLVKALSKCVHQAFPITTEPAKAFHSGQSA